MTENEKKYFDLAKKAKTLAAGKPMHEWPDEAKEAFARVVQYDYQIACHAVESLTHLTVNDVAEDEEPVATVRLKEGEVRLLLMVLDKFKRNDIPALLGDVGYKLKVTKVDVDQTELIKQINELSNTDLGLPDIDDGEHAPHIMPIAETATLEKRKSVFQEKIEQIAKNEAKQNNKKRKKEELK